MGKNNPQDRQKKLNEFYKNVELIKKYRKRLSHPDQVWDIPHEKAELQRLEKEVTLPGGYISDYPLEENIKIIRCLEDLGTLKKKGYNIKSPFAR